jgi:hypothetical protein
MAFVQDIAPLKKLTLQRAYLLPIAALAAERIVKLIALFVLQTVVLPLAFLFLAWRLARAAIREPSARNAAA